MVLTCLVVNFIALIVTIVVNTTVVKDGSNDYGEGYVSSESCEWLVVILIWIF